MTPLRVLHVVPHFDRVGGYERQASTLARHQKRLPDVDPILLTHWARGRPLFQNGPEGEIHRLEKGWRRFHPGVWWKRHGDAVDVVHAHALHKLSAQVVALAHGQRRPTIVKVATEEDLRMFSDPGAWEQALDGDEDAPRGVRWRAMMRAAFRRLRSADLFIALNEGIEEELRALSLPATRVPNGVDTERFHPPSDDERQAAREALGLPADRFCITYVGRLATRKDVGCLVDAFARLASPRTRDPADAGDLHLLLAGDGPARTDLERRLVDAACRDRATLLGEVTDVRDALFAADAFVSPSRREGMPNAVLEAMACGLPVVLSDITAHRALAAGGAHDPDREDALAATLFAPGSSEELASRLDHVQRHRERAREQGDGIRAVVVRSYAMPIVLAHYEQIYRRLAKPREESSAAG